MSNEKPNGQSGKILDFPLERIESNGVPIVEAEKMRSMMSEELSRPDNAEGAVRRICLEFGQENLDLAALLKNSEEASSRFIRKAHDFRAMWDFEKFEEAVIAAMDWATAEEFLGSLGAFIKMERFNEVVAIIERREMEWIGEERPIHIDPEYIMDRLDIASSGKSLDVANKLEALAGSIRKIQAATEEIAINLIKTDREFAEYFLRGHRDLSTMKRLSEARKLAEEKIKEQEPK